MTDDPGTIDSNQGNDAVTVRAKLIYQHSFGRPAKGGSNDIVNPCPIVRDFFANEHPRIIR